MKNKKEKWKLDGKKKENFFLNVKERKKKRKKVYSFDQREIGRTEESLKGREVEEVKRKKCTREKTEWKKIEEKIVNKDLKILSINVSSSL